jgi:multidrug efflux pump
MTSMAFIMGVLPLVLASGAGAEMRSAMGVAVFAGMIGVTAFGLFLTPVFYVLLRGLAGNRALKLHGQEEHDQPAFAGTEAMHERLHGTGADARLLPSAPRHDGE